MSTTQTDHRPRRIRPWWYALALLLSLGIVALVLYSTGVYDSWRDGRSLDEACDGTLAQGGLASALGSSDLRADADEGDSSLAECFVKTSGSEKGRGVKVTLRWSTATAPSGDSTWYDEATKGLKGQAAPLGNGWPGIVRNDGTWQIAVALDCVNHKNKALVAYGDLYGTSDHAALTGLGQVTSETAAKAAEKYGCQAKTGKRITDVSTSRLGTPGTTGTPLKKAQGSCSALRGLAAEATRNGLTGAMEYPADTHAPQVNCYLTTASKKPGYGLYAYYGTMAQDFQAGGFPKFTEDFARATAKCPRSGQETVFVIYPLYDRDTESYPVHYSAEFARSVLKSFAEHEATARGCSDVHMASPS
ncbi:hypothetical protein G3I40_40720 [Streptomyces sp. SID14478]|uniref:hypothetical protein n=1 Tax=Streptomyces sp. SID14478 TaxID=2706073 RepID=UPI0013E05112|nr:hypothetical protein [Streptomyces sp. SID14478]NEB81492.1 hypothetical protein [Streptomyces sp. SID14478]